MTEKELKKLSRQELLEILLVQSKKIDRLQSKLRETEERLADRELKVSNAGSIAEASLVLNNVFADAQKAADQYLENIRRLYEQVAREVSGDDDRTAEDEMPAAETEIAEAESESLEAETEIAEAESESLEAETEIVEAESENLEAEADRTEAESQRLAAEADRAEAARYLEEITLLKKQTERECAEKKKCTDRQIRHSLIRTKKAVQQMMNLYAAEVVKRMKRLQEWDKQMEALHERKTERHSAKSQK